MRSLRELEKIVLSPVEKGGPKSVLKKVVRSSTLLLTTASLIGSGILADRVYAGAVPLRSQNCEINRIDKEFSKLQKQVSIAVSIFPTLVSIPSKDGIIYALGNTREINASGSGMIIGGENAGITLSGELSGFYSSNKIFTSDEQLGSAESAGGFVNASIGGIAKNKNSRIIVFGNFGGGLKVLNVLESEYAGEKGGKQTENGMNWTGIAGLEYVAQDSTLTLSVDGKGEFDINDGSLDLRGLQHYGFNIKYDDISTGNGLFARISGENESGDQTPFNNTFYEVEGTTTAWDIASLFGDNTPDYLKDVSIALGLTGRFNPSNIITKYAEGNKTSCISIGFRYNFEGGKISATSNVSLDNPVATDTGMPPGGITIKYDYSGDQ